MSTYTTYISDVEEDIGTDMGDDSNDPFFPRAGEDETEFAVRWYVRGVIDAFVARETARTVIDEAMSSSEPKRPPSKTDRSKVTKSSFSLVEKAEDNSNEGAKKGKRSTSCPRRSCKRTKALRKKTPKGKRPAGVKKRTYSVPQSSFRWILPKPMPGAREWPSGGTRILADVDMASNDSSSCSTISV